MRRGAEQRPKRLELAWYLAGFLTVQLAVGAGVDQLWSAIRDPEVEQEIRCLWRHRQAALHRPLVVALGSSRTKYGLRADRLNQEAGPDGPLVYNLAIPASGPVFQHIVLRRVLAAGLRPQLVFLEVMPLSLSRRGGTPLEERMLDPARLNAEEMASVYPYYHRTYKAWGPWVAARILPSYRHQAELGNALQFDLPSGTIQTGAGLPLETHGWQWMDRPQTAEAVQTKTQFALSQYESTFDDNTLAPQPAQALRDLLATCRRENLPTALVIPPESTAFRSAYRARYTGIEAYIRHVALEFGVPLHDARTWVEDDGFTDGHHLCVKGADRFTERFEREAFRPALNELYSRLVFHSGGPAIPSRDREDRTSRLLD